MKYLSHKKAPKAQNSSAKFYCAFCASLWLTFIAVSCNHTRIEHRNRIDENRFPARILWAWERAEDLEFLDPNQFAVAFLAQTLVLKNDEVVFRPRRQPLKVGPKVRL